ncbi:hypothetical protein D3C79_966440 [compost metagenome]
MPDPRLAPKPEPEPLDEAHQRWVEELPLTPQERADAALCRETREVNISNYYGSSAEQPGGSSVQYHTEKSGRRTVNEIRADQLRARRNRLL